MHLLLHVCRLFAVSPHNDTYLYRFRYLQLSLRRTSSAVHLHRVLLISNMRLHFQAQQIFHKLPLLFRYLFHCSGNDPPMFPESSGILLYSKSDFPDRSALPHERDICSLLFHSDNTLHNTLQYHLLLPNPSVHQLGESSNPSVLFLH